MTPRQKSLCLVCRIAMRNGCTLTQMLGQRRLKPIYMARQECYVALSERGWSASRIARLMGGRDHSTVIHGISKARERQLWLLPDAVVR